MSTQKTVRPKQKTVRIKPRVTEVGSATVKEVPWGEDFIRWASSPRITRELGLGVVVARVRRELMKQQRAGVRRFTTAKELKKKLVTSVAGFHPRASKPIPAQAAVTLSDKEGLQPIRVAPPGRLVAPEGPPSALPQLQRARFLRQRLEDLARKAASGIAPTRAERIATEQLIKQVVSLISGGIGHLSDSVKDSVRRGQESEDSSARKQAKSSAAADTDAEFRRAFMDLAHQLLEPVPTERRKYPFGANPTSVDIHDFSYYEYLLATDVYQIPDLDFSGVAPSEQQRILSFARRAYYVVYDAVVTTMPDTLVAPDGTIFDRSLDESLSDENLTAELMRLVAVFVAPIIYNLWAQGGATEEKALLLFQFLHQWLSTQITTLGFNIATDGGKLLDPAYWQTSWAIPNGSAFRALGAFLFSQYSAIGWVPPSGASAEVLTPLYDFDPFPQEPVNFGLRVVYRQTWNGLASEAGELVRTIPLGPGQEVNVSTKILRRNKITESLETVTSIERDSETVDTTKDSSEVVAEASKKRGWHAEAEAEAKWGWGKAKVSGGASGESASSSRQTKSHLSEAMQKTASRMRSETKVVVSTERETQFEESRAEKLVNKNDEIAVTYAYARLQRHYWLTTRMQEASSVVFVPEDLPTDITEEWLLEHETVLTQVLLDPALKGVFELLHEPPKATAPVDTKISTAMGQFSNHVGGFASFPGRQVDFFQKPLEIYERELERTREQSRKVEAYDSQVARLKEHIRKNVLHYCRAVWSSMDPDIRMRRYAKRLVPVRWVFIADPAINAPLVPPLDLASGVPGTFVPEVIDPDRDLRPLSEIILPTGPVGYVGNYSVHYLKSSIDLESLNQALAHLRYAYTRCNVQVEQQFSTTDVLVTDVVSSMPAYPDVEYVVTFKQTSTPLLDVVNTHTRVHHKLAFGGLGSAVRFEGIKLVIDGKLPADGDVLKLRATVSTFLEDPELRFIRWTEVPPARSHEASVFTDRRLDDMRARLPELASIMAGSWTDLDEPSRQCFRDAWYEYLLAERHDREVVIDTNSLLLDLDPGETPILEPFKRLHRYVDVLKAFEERERMRLDNERRAELIRSNRLGDPDVEKVTVITGSKQLAAAVAVDVLEALEAEGDGTLTSPGEPR